MELNEIRTILDFGMVVLLWLVQLVIYPSFLHSDKAQLIDWHRCYVRRASCVIIPMMLPQLIVVAWLTVQTRSAADIVALVSIILCWILSFCVSVPLHNRIDKGDTSALTIRRLVLTNWPRTILWSAAFVSGLI